MATSKIDVTVGGVSFSGEGEPEWLAEQLEKVLSAARDTPAAVAPEGQRAKGGVHDSKFTASLASYIREKGADNSQVDRFLVTADWLRRRGVDPLSTGEISKALRDNHQKRLANPADCLNKNVSKGFCEKTGGGFFITPEGLQKLGYE